ncbi:MAG: UDP-N-acetylglucosamine 2-epimerase (non-hydrolyzing) [Rhodobacteraceae bacterium]|nr:UDP-N-acetylglucosamine 2-epimerase (non-hydrolyzing) [Paracoccaceae bacterium]
MKVLTIVGTRPEAIKMAPLVKAIQAEPHFTSVLCASAQHRAMLDQALNLFELKPDYDLNLMLPDQLPHDILTNVVGGYQGCGVWHILEIERPDIVLVQGDTVTTVGSALAAYFAKIPVGHVEAGLRTGKLDSPWPEEGNRRITTSISSHHFAPTEAARSNLLAENVIETSIHVTGNTVIDAMLHVKNKIEKDIKLQQNLSAKFPFISDSQNFILITIHRRESFGHRLEEVCTALLQISKLFPHLNLVLSVHPNPRVKNTIFKYLSNTHNIFLIKPQNYLNFLFLMMRSHIILTDSGGIQEEAPSLGKPVLVIREITERPEALLAGTARLVGTNADRIISQVELLISDSCQYNVMSQIHNPYGDGTATKRILAILRELHPKLGDG